MKRKLTKRTVDSIPLTESGRVVVWDTEIPGFGLVVGKRTKTFVVQRDLHGKSKRVTIGRYGVVTPEEAKQSAREVIVEMTRGVDPNQARRERKLVTLGDAVDCHEQRMRSKECSPRSIELFRTEVMRFLGDWLDSSLLDIEPTDCRLRHQRITDENGPYVANRVMRHLRAAYRTMRREYRDLPEHPIVAVDMNKEYRRQDPIAWDDLPAWYSAVQQLSPVRRDLALFTLLTGLRRRDAASVRWEDIDFDAGTLHRPEPKGGPERAFTIPLSRRVLEILRGRHEENEVFFDCYGGDSGWVFPTRIWPGGELQISHVREPYGRAVKRLPELRSPHRLRDTYISAAHELDVNVLDIKVLVNHRFASRDVTDGYKRASVERLREHQERVSTFLCSKLEQDTGDAAVPLRVVGSPSS